MTFGTVLQSSHLPSETPREKNTLRYLNTNHEFSSILQHSPLSDVFPIILEYLGSKAHREISATLNYIDARRIKFIAKPLPIRTCPHLGEFLIDREVLKVICVKTALPPRLLSCI